MNTIYPNKSFYRRLPSPLTCLLTCALLLSGCAGEPTKTAPPPVVIAPGQAIPEPTPSEPEQALDLAALEAVKNIAANQGTLVARGHRNALLIRGLDATSAAIIDSHIAWLEGNLAEADELLSVAAANSRAGSRYARKEKLHRLELEGEWLAAAQLAHAQLLDPEDREIASKDKLWSLLLHLDDSQLTSALMRADTPDWRGWLALNQAYRKGRDAVNTWLATAGGHSAIRPMPAALDIWLDTTPPETVAVMLPLTGRLASAGEAVLQGVVEAVYVQYPDAAGRPKITTIDTEEFPDVISAYRAAVRGGANVVIGPLTKADAQTIGSLRERPAAVIALNRPEALPPSDAEAWNALSLAPEDEARQIASIAFGNGQRRALIIRPDTDWGRRMEAALTQRWRTLGGTVVAAVALASEPSESEQISIAVGGADSEARIKAVEKAFEAPVESRPRRRQDFDSIFLVAPGPAEARSLRPLLVYHYSGDVPVYATSAANSGNSHIQNRDLNGLTLVEIPAVLASVDVDRYTRLSALGKDAIGMLDHWQQAEGTTAPFLRAHTGLLQRRSNGEIERELIPVEFDGGSLRRVNVP